MSNAIKITRRQTSGAMTRRKCPECKELISTFISGKFRKHNNCPASGYAPSEWKVEKAKRDEEALKRAEETNSWWAKEGL